MAGTKGRGASAAGAGVRAGGAVLATGAATAPAGDLAERVARLERALGEAGVVLAGAGGVAVDASTAATTGGTPTKAAYKGVRSVIQLGIAAVPGVIVSTAAGWSPQVAGWITVALAPLVTFAQNELEDLLVIPAVLREPSPKGPKAVAKAAAKAAAAEEAPVADPPPAV